MAPLFVLLLFTLLDFGRVVFAWNAITNNAREGARVGSVSSGGITGNAAWQARYGEIRAAARGMSPGVTMQDIDIKGCRSGFACMKSAPCPVPDDTATGTCFYTCPDGLTGEGCTVYVEITLNVPLLTPIVSTILGGSFSLTAVSEALVQS